MLHTPAENVQAQRRGKIEQSAAGVYDLAVIGGGIHGASLCRQAAAAGLKTVLLEARDYGFGISSRSSKMLHGGVRYLEQGDVWLVREALAERAYLLAQAPHLTRAQPFLLPIVRGLGRPVWQMRIGLAVYDFLSFAFRPRAVARQAQRFRPHARLGPDSRQWQILSRLGLEHSALLRYYDGQMDDTRIVIENIIDAEELGAITLNFAEVDSFDRAEDGSGWAVRWQDVLGGLGQTHLIRAANVANMAGPWVPEVHARFQPWPDRWPQPLYSRGIHLLFDVQWPTSGLILPTDEQGRYYFIWPYFSAAGRGTLVGPTSKSVERNEADPQPEEDEIAELLGYLERDFPNAGLNRRSMISSFCGMRILAGPMGGRRSGPVSRVSREDKLLELPGYIALLGGKYTTSRRTAETILKKILRRHGGGSIADTAVRPLPGGRGWGPPMKRRLVAALRKRLVQADASGKDRRVFAQQLRAAVRRFGAQAERLLKPPYSEEGPLDVEQLVRAQVRYTMLNEQALDQAGVLSRLGWDDFPQLAEGYEQVIASEINRLQAEEQSTSL